MDPMDPKLMSKTKLASALKAARKAVADAALHYNALLVEADDEVIGTDLQLEPSFMSSDDVGEAAEDFARVAATLHRYAKRLRATAATLRVAEARRGALLAEAGRREYLPCLTKSAKSKVGQALLLSLASAQAANRGA